MKLRTENLIDIAFSCLPSKLLGFHCTLCAKWNFPATSVQFSRSVMSDSLQSQGLQHSRLPCPSPTPGAYLNSCPSHLWCHPTIWSFVIPFSSHLQSFPASESFPMSWFFASGGQSIGVAASAWSFQWIFRTDFLLEELVGSPCSPRDSQASSPTPQFKSISSSMLAPWKKSYDKSRQHIKKQRHYFADKGLYSQSFGFSCSYVWVRVGP